MKTIISQIVRRHGRVVLQPSNKCFVRSYASEPSKPRSLLGEHQARRPPGDVPVRGHPDNETSIVDTIDRAPTAETRVIEEHLHAAEAQSTALQGDINAIAAGKNHGVVPPRPNLDYSATKQMPPAPYPDLATFYAARAAQKELKTKQMDLKNAYFPWTIVERPPRPEELDLPMLLANQTHLGHATALWNPSNSGYIFGIRQGIHIISLDITLSYLRRAAKVIQEVARRGGIILFVGTRDGHQDIVVNSAKIASPAYHIFDRWTPGSLTNGQQILNDCAVKVVNTKDEEITSYREKLAQGERSVLKPDLVVCLNPLENEVCLHECGLHNVPTIGIIDTDANPTHVTYPIPANDDSLRSVALISGALARAAQTGQKQRLEAAADGQATYSTAGAKKFLADMEAWSALQTSTRESDETSGKRKAKDD